jgi:hypothetical protein
MRDPEADLEVVDLEAELEGGGRRSPVAGSSAPASAPTSTPGSAPGAGRRRRWWWAALVLVVAGVAWAGLAYGLLTGVRADLFTAREDLLRAAELLSSGELEPAVALLGQADRTLAAVPDRVSGPAVLPARAWPPAARTMDAVAGFARAAHRATAAGVDALEGLEGGGGIAAFTPVDGRLPVASLDDLARVLGDAHAELVAAVASAEALPVEGADPAVADAVASFVEVLGPVADQLGALEDLAAVLPSMAGADGPRRYLVLASNPAESRGAGGFWGAYTVMTADEGALTFSDVVPTQDLPRIPAGEIPWPDPTLEARYDAYGGTGFVENLNMTPDFPSAAVAVERFYEASAGEPVDGVIAVDPYAFQSLLRVAGPVEVPGVGRVGPDEVVEFVSRTAYTAILDPEERKRLIGLVAAAALQGFLSSPDGIAAADVLAMLSEVALRDSILVHAVREEEQRALEALGVDGGLGGGEGGDLVAVALNSGSPSKVDYWLDRSVSADVVLGPDGSVATILTAAMANGAPTEGEPAYMIGADLGILRTGDTLHLVSAYCAPGCTFTEVPDAGLDDRPTDVGTELGFGVSSTWVKLPSMRAAELTWTTTTPDAWVQEGEVRTYRLHYDHQPTIRPTTFRLGVAVPSGFRAVVVPEGAEVVDGRVVLEREVVSDLSLEVVFAPID